MCCTDETRLDEKTEVFKDGFDALEHKLSDRYYTSVAAFSADLTAVLLPVVARLDGMEGDFGIHDITDIHAQLNGVQPGTAQHLALSHEQKELKKVTKRIAKAVKEMVDVARKKEAELKGIPFEKEMGEWAAFDARLEKSILPKDNGAKLSGDTSVSVVGGASPSPRNRSSSGTEDTVMHDAEDVAQQDQTLKDEADAHAMKAMNVGALKNQPLSPPTSTSGTPNNLDDSAAQMSSSAIISALPPGDSRAQVKDPWANGGTPWYLDAFDISGTTVHDERWTGKRAMSEALSEMDEETLQDLKEQSTGAATEEDSNATAATSRPRRTRASTIAEPAAEADGPETDEQKVAREKREKANAKRRAQRRRNKW